MNARTRCLAPRAGLILALFVLGCAGFDPRPMEEIPFLERTHTQEREGLRVTVAVLSDKESKHAFGVDLADKRIQPVWVEIQNQRDIPYLLMLTGLDPAYFSAREAAYKSHFRLRHGTNRKIDKLFAERGIDTFIPPGESRSGFIFSNLKLGTKEVRVKLYGPGRVHLFEFYVPIPGFRADWHEADFDTLFAQETVDVGDEDALRQALKALPCCTTKKNGKGEGDPINLIFIGEGEELGNALIRAGWDETEKLTWNSGWRTFKAFFGGTYKYSPMSALYAYGRSQDAGFQKARDTIHERNHLRLWLSPKRYQGKQVWIGTITRDIGVYFTTRTWNFTTHAIDPDVDEARAYLREDFQVAQSVERWGYVEGVGAATDEEPHYNLMGAPWWTDGLRLVMDVPPGIAIPLEEQRFFYWDWGDEDAEAFNERLRQLAE